MISSRSRGEPTSKKSENSEYHCQQLNLDQENKQCQNTVTGKETALSITVAFSKQFLPDFGAGHLVLLQNNA